MSPAVAAERARWQAAALPVHQHVLANGWRVVLQPDPDAPLTALHVTFPAGARWDPPGRAGLAHACEHLAFFGSSEPDARPLPELTEQLGGSSRATTQLDRVRFSQLLPGRHLELAVKGEAERFRRTRQPVPAEALARQVRVLEQELRQRPARSSHEQAFRPLFAQLFPSPAPYHRTPAGEPDQMARLTPGDCADFFRRHYRPNGAVLALSGDFRPEAALALVRQHLETSAQPVSPPAPVPLEPVRSSVRSVTGRVGESRIYLGFRGPGLGEPSWLATDLLLRVLALERFQPWRRLFARELGEEVQVECFWIPLAEASVAVVCARAAAGRSLPGAAGGAILLEHAAQSPPTGRTELERARRKAIRDHLVQLDRLDRRAAWLAERPLDPAGPASLLQQVEGYAALTRQDLEVAARRLWCAGVALLVRPEEDLR